MKITFITIGLILLSFVSISQINIDVIKNIDIPDTIKSNIELLNNKIFKSIESRNADLFYNEVISDKLKTKEDGSLKSFILQLSMSYDKKGYEIKDQFFIPKIKEKQDLIITGEKDTEYEYKLEFGIGNADSYVSLLTFNNETILLGLIYRKYDNEWRLHFFGAGYYKYRDKLSFDYYKTATTQLNKGYFVDAGLNAPLIKLLLKPNQFYSYTKHDIMYNFVDKVDSIVKSKYSFPVTIESIKTKPKVFLIELQEMKEGIFPMVNYVSTIPISNTKKLKNENDLIQKQIGILFPGLDKDKKYIFYSAHDRLPNKWDKMEVYGFVQEIKKE